jgi:hypothetical protein
MSDFLYTLLIVFTVLLISFGLLAIKYLIKGEEFKKTCSTTGEKCSCNTEHDEEKQCENQVLTR